MTRRKGRATHRSGYVGACVALLGISACSLDSITSASESNDWRAGTALHLASVGSRPRTYTLHVPSKRLTSASVPVPWPLVIVLHGSSADGAAIQEQSAMNALADSALFLAAYPDGSSGDFGVYPSDWNAGTCCGGAFRDNVNDVAFMTAIIAQVSLHEPVNTRKVYVAGFSAGGRMAFHVGCQMSTAIAAIGVVSGSLVDDACAPKNPMPLIAIHGTEDPEVAFDEPAPPFSRAVPPAANAVTPATQFWTALYRCTGGTRVVVAPHVFRSRFTTCATGTDIDFYTIAGGTHGWPGGPVDPGSQPPMNEIRASLLLWQFFTRHTRK